MKVMPYERMMIYADKYQHIILSTMNRRLDCRRLFRDEKGMSRYQTALKPLRAHTSEIAELYLRIPRHCGSFEKYPLLSYIVKLVDFSTNFQKNPEGPKLTKKDANLALSPRFCQEPLL
ncbi:hypothetical protein TNCV_4103011 [Trichonephila clavipes]|nr:hypothetical protein TNCV_4103011 [Trichonephila clavipes]